MILGYFGLSLMGICLGLLGAGGSILAIPIFIYFFNIPVLKSTTYSLCVVSIVAMLGFIKSRKNVVLSKAFHFAIPSVTGVFLSRFFILPHLPSSLGFISLNKALILLLVTFMFAASYFMIRPLKIKKSNQNSNETKNIQVHALGFFVGIFMGFLGSGGGFLIIPILILFLKLNMTQAVATSLSIISINSCIGFLADKTPLYASDYVQLLKFLSIAILGMLIGIALNKKIDASKLKTAFGWFIVIIGIAIFIKEFIITQSLL